jgi:GH25 family lysozyme M1 (1,4-beta-N-acetylmuramidase)
LAARVPNLLSRFRGRRLPAGLAGAAAALALVAACYPLLARPPALRRGVDVSKWGGAVPVASWQRLRQTGWHFAVVGSWGSYGLNPHARTQLAGARKAGLDTAVYALLHFDDPAKSGEWQVAQALASLGDEARHLHFLALDVEIKGGPVRVDAVALIADAVRAVERRGLRPVIYTSRRDWIRMTGDSTAFSHLPLWMPRYDGVPQLNVDGRAPWVPFGGWTTQTAKQHRGTTRLHGISVDLNVSLPELWRRAG